MLKYSQTRGIFTLEGNRLGRPWHRLPNMFVQLQQLGKKVTRGTGISSVGRPVSTPTDTFLSIDFLAELFFSKEFAQALTINAATKPPILLYGVRQLDPNIF